MTPTPREDYSHLHPVLVEFAALPADDPRRAAMRDKLVAGFLPVVQHIARRFNGRGEPHDDIVQTGTFGLIRAVDRFDPGRGVDFLPSPSHDHGRDQAGTSATTPGACGCRVG